MLEVKRIFFIPFGPSGLKDQLFLSSTSSLGKSFEEFFSSKGIEVKTIDAWDVKKHNNATDALVVLNHPDDSWPLRLFYAWRFRNKPIGKFPVSRRQFHILLKAFSRKILFQSEPPIVMPYPYKHLANLKGLYAKIFSTVDFHDPDIGHFVLPYQFKDKEAKFFDIPKTKFLTVINSNSRPHGFWRKELYSERLRAVRYFSSRKDFDLYGNRWDKKPFLHWSYAPYTRRAWRGRLGGIEIEDKLPTLAQYKFNILFENSIFPGYVDIKFIDPLVTGTVPIYLGAPDVTDYVPKECFIDMRDFALRGERGYDYAKVESYLRSLTDADLERYRSSIREFLHSDRAKVFTSVHFAEMMYAAIQALP